MKPIYDLFDDVWKKKEDQDWDCVYIMIDLHGVIIPPNYHRINDLQFIHRYTQQCLQYFSDQDDIKLILWSSSYKEEIQKVVKWLASNKIYFDYFNENPLENNTKYADFSKKPYFSILLEDKAGFTENDWVEINRWIAIREMSKLK